MGEKFKLTQQRNASLRSTPQVGKYMVVVFLGKTNQQKQTLYDWDVDNHGKYNKFRESINSYIYVDQ